MSVSVAAVVLFRPGEPDGFAAVFSCNMKVVEGSRLLALDAASSGECLPTFRKMFVLSCLTEEQITVPTASHTHARTHTSYTHSRTFYTLTHILHTLTHILHTLTHILHTRAHSRTFYTHTLTHILRAHTHAHSIHIRVHSTHAHSTHTHAHSTQSRTFTHEHTHSPTRTLPLTAARHGAR
jgi:hypothetical protein